MYREIDANVRPTKYCVHWKIYNDQERQLCLVFESKRCPTFHGCKSLKFNQAFSKNIDTKRGGGLALLSLLFQRYSSWLAAVEFQCFLEYMGRGGGEKEQIIIYKEKYHSLISTR